MPEFGNQIKIKEEKYHDFQRPVFRAQAPEITGCTNNYYRKENRHIGAKRQQVARLDEEAFENYLRNNTPYLEQYRAFIISILKICPQTPATNIMYRIKDQFPDFNCKKTTFFKYVRDLREQTGYVKPSERPTSFREETPPGYEAQVDFGQFKMKDMYDRNIRVYFFCMVLLYSRMRFVYFSREPFCTKTAVDAHK